MFTFSEKIRKLKQENYLSQLNVFFNYFFLSFTGNNQNSCSKLGNVFMMRAGDHE